jgi:hypothetical protein
MKNHKDYLENRNINNIKKYIMHNNKSVTTNNSEDDNTISTDSFFSVMNDTASTTSGSISIASNGATSAASNGSSGIVSNGRNSVASNCSNRSSGIVSNCSTSVVSVGSSSINENNSIFSNNYSARNETKSNNSNNSNSFYHKNNNNNNNNNNNKSNFLSINNKITIDVAVLCQEYTTIEKMCDDHIINLDEIEITRDTFQNIFYPYCENFGINKNNVSNNSFYAEYISFLPEYRTVNKKKFYLLEEIISNIESDLNISRNCFTVESLVELTNEIISVNSFCDVNCCSVLSSLTWSNILEIIQNYSIINENCGCDSSSQKGQVIPICVISIVFKTPTPGVKNTIVRFNYKIIDL